MFVLCECYVCSEYWMCYEKQQYCGFLARPRGKVVIWPKVCGHLIFPPIYGWAFSSLMPQCYATKHTAEYDILALQFPFAGPKGPKPVWAWPFSLLHGWVSLLRFYSASIKAGYLSEKMHNFCYVYFILLACCAWFRSWFKGSCFSNGWWLSRILTQECFLFRAYIIGMWTYYSLFYYFIYYTLKYVFL